MQSYPDFVILHPQRGRRYTLEIIDELQRDPQLVNPARRPYQGKLQFPWAYGVVLPNVTRKQFTDGGLNYAIDPSRVICSDEMTESVDAEQFQQRMWQMFKYQFREKPTLPQIDRIRWILFPEVRITPQQRWCIERGRLARFASMH